MKKLLILSVTFLGSFILSSQTHEYAWSNGIVDDVLPNGLLVNSINSPSNTLSEIAGGLIEDHNGDVITTGSIHGSFYDLSPVQIVYQTPGGVIFIQKKDADGNVLWSNFIDGGNFIIPSATRLSKAIVVDSQNNIFICGRVNDTTDFDVGSGQSLLVPQNTFAAYVAKYDPNGNLLFVYPLLGTGDIDPREMTVDQNDNVYVSGIYSKIVDFDGGPNSQMDTSRNNQDDIFLLKIDNNGQYVWHRDWGSRFEDDPGGLEIDAKGNILIGGFFDDSLDIDPGPRVHTLVAGSGGTANNAYISKFDPSGSWMWSTLLRCNSQSTVFDLDTDGENVGIIGTYAGTMEVISGSTTTNLPAVAPTNRNIVVMKLDSAGEFLWNYSPQPIGSNTLFSFGTEIAEHNKEWYIRVTTGLADLDNGPAVDSAVRTTTSQFLVKISEAGNYQWNKKFEMNGNGFFEFYDIKADDEEIYLMGSYRDAALDANPDPNQTNLHPRWFFSTIVLIKLEDTSFTGTPSGPVFDYVERQKGVSSVRARDDNFGNAVAISGDYAIIAANGDDEDENNANPVTNSGSGYIYHYNGLHWAEAQKIAPPDRAIGESYGTAVDIEGQTIAFCGPLDGDDANGMNWMLYAGSVTMFEMDTTGNWQQTQKIAAADRDATDLFGSDVSIYGDVMAISALGTDLNQGATDTVMNSGGVYIYKRDSLGVWNFHQKLVASDRDVDDFFGVSIHLNGDLLAVGVPDEDHDELDTAFMAGSGSVYLFEQDASGNWSEIQKVVATDRTPADGFGNDVQIGNGFLIIGAKDSDKDENGGNPLGDAGAVYVYKEDSVGSWVQHQKLLSSQRESGDGFGNRLALDRNQLVVSTAFDDEDEDGANSVSEAGLIHVFRLNSQGLWTEFKKLASSDRSAFDRFGAAVGIDDGWIISAAPDEDEDTLGSNFLPSSGAVYFFNETVSCFPAYDSLTETSCGVYTSPSGVFLWDSTGTYIDTVTTMYGCDSILTIDLTVLQAPTGTDIQRACFQYTWIDGITYTASNDSATYIIAGGGANGCDSLVSLDLTIDTVNANVSVNGFNLTSQSLGATYQWLDCDSMMRPILGATNQTFTAAPNRNYAVEVTKNGCVDTSGCIAVSTVGLNANPLSGGYKMYPNPTKGTFTISFENIQERVEIRVFSASGKLLLTDQLNFSNIIQLELNQPNGVYFVEMEDAYGYTYVQMLVKSD